MALPFTENFTAADFTVLTTHNAGWTQVGNTPKIDIYQNGARHDVGSFGYGAARWDGDTFNADHSAQITIKKLTTSAAGLVSGAFIRGSGVGAAFTGYVAWLYSVDGKLYVSYFDGISGGGAGTVHLGSALNTLAVNDVVKIWAVGSAIHASVNGVECTGSPWTNTTLSGSATHPGIITTDYSAAMIDVFVADNVGAAAATAVTMSGPSSGVSGAASTNFTIGANGTITGTVIVTPSDAANGGTFTPATVSISSAAPTATFTYTPASAGAKTISVTNNGALTNPANITYTASAPALYVEVNAVDPIGGQNIKLLVPSTGSAVPYNAANPTNVILYCHGAGEDQTALTADSLKFTSRDALINAGYILAGSNAGGGTNWGGQASVDAYTALAKYVRNNYNVRAIALWSQSMGGLPGLQTLAQNKIDVCGWLGTYPVCNLANLYGLGTYAADINTTFGITGSGDATYANKTYGADPALKVARAYKDVPMRFYASAADTVVPKANNTDVLQAIVAESRHEASIVVCTGNHGDTSHFQPSDYLAFFQRCFAAAIPSVRTVSLTLTTDGTTALANATGLKWAFYEEVTPDLKLKPIAKGAGATTTAAGLFSVSVSTHLGIGAVGWLIVTNSDGTTTQTPAHKAFSGPVVLS